jgi:hypothetical protein
MRNLSFYLLFAVAIQSLTLSNWRPYSHVENHHKSKTIRSPENTGLNICKPINGITNPRGAEKSGECFTSWYALVSMGVRNQVEREASSHGEFAQFYRKAHGDSAGAKAPPFTPLRTRANVLTHQYSSRRLMSLR